VCGKTGRGGVGAVNDGRFTYVRPPLCLLFNNFCRMGIKEKSEGGKKLDACSGR
jgi:hypothetical protein